MSQSNKFISENYYTLADAAKKISGNDTLWEELLHYSIEEFLRKKDAESITESGGARFYIVKIMMNSWRSTTSAFYYTYKKPSTEYEEYYEEEGKEIAEEEDNTLELAQKIQEELNKLSWYDRKLFQTFVEENHTISSLSRCTNIPRTSISLSINRIRKHIKKNI